MKKYYLDDYANMAELKENFYKEFMEEVKEIEHNTFGHGIIKKVEDLNLQFDTLRIYVDFNGEEKLLHAEYLLYNDNLKQVFDALKPAGDAWKAFLKEKEKERNRKLKEEKNILDEVDKHKKKKKK